MRLCYVLLSPTWGMHQYTAGLANRMQEGRGNGETGREGPPFEVHLVTTAHYPADRYSPAVRVHTPVAARDSGFSVEAMWRSWPTARQALAAIRQVDPDVVHLTGPHLCNPLLLRALRRAGVPTVHSLHDLHPHRGSAYGRLLYLWNGWVRREAGHLLVHGRRYGDELLARGVDPARLSCTPLTHLFVGHEQEGMLRRCPPAVEYGRWALFLGRLEAYKGLDVLVEAAQRAEGSGVGVVIAGPGRLDGQLRGPLPANVELRAGLAGDDEAVDLFRRCGLVVLPYVEASQSALVGAAYFFGKPALVSRAGALPEYVVEGETGWVVSPGDSQALAEALGAALADPDRLARMGRAGRAWYDEQRQAEGTALRAMYAGLAGCAWS